jgi:hypothetical protein
MNFSIILRSVNDWLEPKTDLIKRILFSLLILGITSGAGLLLPQKYQMLVVVFIVGMFGMVFLYQQPQLGLVVLVGATLTVPLSLGTGTGTELNVAVLLVLALFGCWILGLIFKKKNSGFFYSRPVIPLFIFLVIVILAFGFGQIRWFPGVSPAPIRAQLGAVALFFLSAMACLIASNQIEDLRWLKRMVFIFLAFGSVYIFLRLFPISNLSDRLFPPGAAGSIFWIWIVVTAFSQGVFNHSLDIKWRVALGCLVFGTLFIGVILDRGWTSGWLPAVFGLVIAAWFGLPKYWKTFAIILGLCLLLALPAISAFIMTSDNEYSMVTRLEAWNVLGKIISVNPFFGVGPANYYWYTRLFPIMGYFSLSFNSHNNFIDLIAQTGFLGLGAFLWFTVEIMRLTRSLNIRVGVSGFERAFLIGGMGGLAGTLFSGVLGDWFIPFVYNIGYAGFRSSVIAWLFLGGIIAIEKNLAKSNQVMITPTIELG